MLPFLEGILSYAGDTLGIANINTNDAAAQSPSHDVPSNPFAGVPPTARPPIIDLASSPGPPKPRKVQKKIGISDDERRLVGDYSTPADAVAIPDPHSWFTKDTQSLKPATNRSTMIKKPGANNSFRPINTISDVNTGAGGHRSVTYARQHRTPKPIGQEQHRGQIAYLEQHHSTTPVRSSHLLSSHQENHARSGAASPLKRRKTEHVINLADEDDVQEVFPSSAPLTPTLPTYHREPSVRSSQKSTSVGSGTTMTESKQTFQSQSEFRATDELVDPRRKKVRTPRLGSRLEGSRASPFGGGGVSTLVNSSVRSPPVVLLDDVNASTRQQLFLEFQQGVSARPARARTRPSQSPQVVASRHFQNARINESTSNVQNQTAASSRFLASSDKTLRSTHVPVPRKSVETDDSADELALLKPTDYSHRRKSSKAMQSANSGVKRKDVAQSPSKGWPLKFARTHEFETQGPDLWLRPSAGNPKEYRIIGKDADHKVVRKTPSVFLGRVNALEADNTSCIRLKGGRKADSNMYTFDLEFTNREDFIAFRDEHAVLRSGVGKYNSKEESWMRKIFDTGLPNNYKVGKFSPANEAESTPIVSSAHANVQVNSNKTPLLTRLMNKSPTNKVAEKIAMTGLSPPTTSRSLRSTKTSVSAYNLDEKNEHRDVEKYSETVGLGVRWAKSLEYGKERHRAVVHFDDLARLDEEEFMNDSLIDFYMIYLFDKLKVPSDKVYFFNTYFFTALTQNKGRQSSMNYAAVERWTQKIDIFGYDYVVVPINEATHWYLAIICNVSNIDRKPVIEDFDKDHGEDMEENCTNKSEEAPGFCPPLSTDSPAELSERGNGNDEDANLFEEESEINLVDPHATGIEERSLLRRSNSEEVTHLPTSGGADMACASDRSTENNGNFLQLSKLPEKKKNKKSKRKYMPPKRDPNEPIILILDSLGQTRSATVRALKDWLAAEGKAKRGMEAAIKEKGYYPKASQIPMQNNWTDCGIYLLGYVDKFFSNPDDFKNRLLLGEMSSDEDWPELKPKEMRKAIRETIFQCAKDQEITRKEEKKKMKRGRALVNSKSTVKATTNDENSVELVSMGSRLKSVPPKGADSTDAQVPLEVLKPRLASPFEFSPPSAGLFDQKQSSEVEGRAPSSLHMTESPVRPTSKTPRRKSPEVRIPSRTTPQPYTSKRDQQLASFETGDQSDDRRAMLSSPSMMSNREGSALNMPIEILDSQDTKPTEKTRNKRLQTDALATNTSAGRLEKSLEEASLPSFAAQRTDVDEGVSADGEVMAKLNAKRRNEGYINRDDEAVFDLMELDMLEGDAMDVDRLSRGSVVDETREPDQEISNPRQWTETTKGEGGLAA